MIDPDVRPVNCVCWPCFWKKKKSHVGSMVDEQVGKMNANIYHVHPARLQVIW